MGKMHDRFKSAKMTVTTVDLSSTKVEGAKEHFIDFTAKGLVNIFERKTTNPVSVELVAPIATYLHAIVEAETEQISSSAKNAKMHQNFQKIGTELHKVSIALGINDSDSVFREYVQSHISDLLSEVREEIKRFTIEKFTKDFMSTPSEPGATIIASGMGGPMFEAMDMSRFKSK